MWTKGQREEKWKCKLREKIQSVWDREIQSWEWERFSVKENDLKQREGHTQSKLGEGKPKKENRMKI